jgi:hypothetical protein
MVSVMKAFPNLEKGRLFKSLADFLVVISCDKNPFTWEFLELMTEKYQMDRDNPGKFIITPSKFWLGDEYKAIPRSLVLKNAVVYIKNKDKNGLLHFKKLTFYG